MTECVHARFEHTAGKLPSDYPIDWRGDAALSDGQDVGLDLTGGLFDAGDHIKFGLPMAYTATLLSWAALEYRDRLQGAGLLGGAMDAVAWIADYLVKASPPGQEVYYFQVSGSSDLQRLALAWGDGNAHHPRWFFLFAVTHQSKSPRTGS